MSRLYFPILLFVLIIPVTRIFSQSSDCPEVNLLLTQCYSGDGVNHTPTQGGNWDEVGVYSQNPFLLKVDNYPPLRAWPWPLNFGGSCPGFYLSFDSRTGHEPIPFWLLVDSWHSFSVYSLGSSWLSFNVKPPSPESLVDPSTVISYQLPKAGLVTVKVYDMLGKEVQVLVNGYKESGKYTVEFNGAGLASGVYVYRLDCNDYHATKKLTLLK